MADNKKTKKSKPTGEATAAKYVLGVLKKAHATSPNKAVEISAFKDLPLSTPTISFTIANFIDQGVIHQTEDNRCSQMAIDGKKCCAWLCDELMGAIGIRLVGGHCI